MGERERTHKKMPGISGVPDELDERLSNIETQISLLTTTVRSLTAEQKPKGPSFLFNLLQGVTLLSIIGFAFWLGGMSAKITATSDKVDKISAVVLESRDSISSRMASVEAKLDSIDKKLDGLAENSKDKKGD